MDDSVEGIVFFPGVATSRDGGGGAAEKVRRVVKKVARHLR